VTHAVTMGQLMGHVGGLRERIGHLSSVQRHRAPRVERRFPLTPTRDIDDVNFAPAIAWNYNNGGYMMLSAAIERNHRPIARGGVARAHLRARGDVRHITASLRHRLVPNSATPHMTKQTGGFEKSYLGSAADGCGGVISTVDDMLRWLAHMDAPWVGQGTDLGSHEAPHYLANGCSTGYGLV